MRTLSASLVADGHARSVAGIVPRGTRMTVVSTGVIRSRAAFVALFVSTVY